MKARVPSVQGIWSGADYRFMARAIRLARRGVFTSDPNPRVGCVLVQGEEIVGEGWHERAGQPHAERNALAKAGAAAQGATAYVTLEPCCHVGRTGPCTRALIDAGVGRVVTAMTDPNPLVAGQGHDTLAEAGMQVETGLMTSEAASLNPGFILRMTKGRPFVRCKLAMSLDGRTAMASGESQWITGTEARSDVQRLRARSSAILTGIGTVLADNPSMTIRPAELGVSVPSPLRQPRRIVLDPTLATPPDAAILACGKDKNSGESGAYAKPRTMLMVSEDVWVKEETREKAAVLQAMGAEIIPVPGTSDALDLGYIVQCLARQELNEVLLECGARLAGAMLREKRIDELIIYLAPTIMGSGARGLFDLPGLARMADRIPMRIMDIRAVGQDFRITILPS